MKKFWCLPIVLAIFGAFIAQAQPRQMQGERRLQMLKDSLQLTSDQEKKVADILKQEQTAFENAREENRGDREAMRAFMLKQTKKTDEQIKSVLTKEQAEKYDSIMKARREQMREKSQQRKSSSQ
jgi:Spy/CpxP family protein refolding chaperone